MTTDVAIYMSVHCGDWLRMTRLMSLAAKGALVEVEATAVIPDERPTGE